MKTESEGMETDISREEKLTESKGSYTYIRQNRS